MKRGIAYGAVSALTLLVAQQANAQQLRGVRGDAAIGIDRFYSEGNHDDEVAYQGALGVDMFVGDNFVLGAEGTFLWSTNENETVDGPGVAFRKSFQEWAGAVRAGVMVTPSTLIYGKLGYGVNEQRKRFEAFTPARQLLQPLQDQGLDRWWRYRANARRPLLCESRRPLRQLQDQLVALDRAARYRRPIRPVG